uniref:Uncharacterized protein n=1 Tax=Thermogemmatispora argillosa TaxID=2045280 RepID=A0A455SUU3_9CHLR|nr:hypothetical protein KTA_03920 [Thermogemmatispora argillosa]
MSEHPDPASPQEASPSPAPAGPSTARSDEAALPLQDQPQLQPSTSAAPVAQPGPDMAPEPAPAQTPESDWFSWEDDPADDGSFFLPFQRSGPLAAPTILDAAPDPTRDGQMSPSQAANTARCQAGAGLALVLATSPGPAGADLVVSLIIGGMVLPLLLQYTARRQPGNLIGPVRAARIGNVRRMPPLLSVSLQEARERRHCSWQMRA